MTGRRRKRAVGAPEGAPHPLDFFGTLVWLDGKPLLRTIEPYRRAIFQSVLWTFDENGHLQFNLHIDGRAKKNNKTTDLSLSCLYRFIAWPSSQGNDCFILANDAEQAGDDLGLIKKLIAANPVLDREVTVNAKSITRKDGKGSLQILPAKDVSGAHGKTFLFIGYDEIHAYKDYGILEALSPDPTRADVLVWVTSYNAIRSIPGAPLHDFFEAGKAGTDPRMHFTWYSGDYCSDPAFADLPPEQRANPSMQSWANPGYLDQQRRRLPTSRFRRLHLNLPGAPDGAAIDADAIMAAIIPGRKQLPPEPGRRYRAFVDMSGGSSDEAVLGISYFDQTTRKAVLAALISQAGKPPFNPRNAVRKFCLLLKEFKIVQVTGDAYAGQTFRADFEAEGIRYEVAGTPKSDIYEALEPRLNAGEVELLDIPELQEQLLTLVWRGNKIYHQPGDHDDWANSCAGAIFLASSKQVLHIPPGALAWASGRDIRPDLTSSSPLPFGRF